MRVSVSGSGESSKVRASKVDFTPLNSSRFEVECDTPALKLLEWGFKRDSSMRLVWDGGEIPWLPVNLFEAAPEGWLAEWEADEFDDVGADGVFDWGEEVAWSDLKLSIKFLISGDLL